MVQIREIDVHSLGERSGFKVGDRIHRVNGHEISDPLDFYVHSSDPYLQFAIERDGEFYDVEVARKSGESCGFTFEEMKLKKCNNKCAFCFIHQLPRGMRRRLYFEDDDYRLSFLHGSYVTLTNVQDHDLERIIEQRLSPQYISVHTTDPQLRQSLLGRKKATVDILEHIARLSSNGIEMHTQVVLCPGWNDGLQLKRTVRDLSLHYPAVRSIALVPVGLTQFRQHLPAISPVTPLEAKEYILQAEAWGKNYIRRFGKRFVYAADELYLLANRTIPPATHYEGFPQIENGIGMVRAFLDTWENGKRKLPKQLLQPFRLGLVSGQLASRFLSSAIVDLNQIVGLEVELITVENNFFGPGITVSGLLTGSDILNNIKGGSWDHVLLPPNCVNEEGLTLDDMPVSELEARAGIAVSVGHFDLAKSMNELLGTRTRRNDLLRPYFQSSHPVARPAC